MHVFPQYRTYPDGQSVFRIISENEFEECQRVGSKILFHKVLAEAYPEKLLIKDMLECHAERYKITTEGVFHDMLRSYQQQ